ncbi:MAG: hypothetical protein AAF570_02845, partial [Bacteroidota bacterium]
MSISPFINRVKSFVVQIAAMTLFCLFQFLGIISAQVNENYHRVGGHYRNGKWVEPYYRTNPNSTNR